MNNPVGDPNRIISTHVGSNGDQYVTYRVPATGPNYQPAPEPSDGPFVPFNEPTTVQSNPTWRVVAAVAFICAFVAMFVVSVWFGPVAAVALSAVVGLP